MRRRSEIVLAVAALAGAVLLLAQQKPPAGPPAGTQAKEDSGDAVFTADSRLVPLNVTVSDKAGHLIAGLTRGAFQVLENGAVQQIKDFKHEDVPVSLGLIIDNSGSMREKRQSVESAALALVRDSNPQDEAFVVNFNDEAYLDAPADGKGLTSDIRILEQGLTKIDSRGGTAMRDAIRMSMDHLKKYAKRDKKVILVVTDGNDNASGELMPAIVRQAQQEDILVYAIGLLSEEEKKDAAAAKRALDLLTSSTGGQVFYPKDVSEVEKIAHEVAHDIRNQYTITYTPTNQKLDSSFRTIKVLVKAPGNPVARTRQGYYATPEEKRPARGL
jgi:Ca-activated chloride channel family protein